MCFKIKLIYSMLKTIINLESIHACFCLIYAQYSILKLVQSISKHFKYWFKIITSS